MRRRRKTKALLAYSQIVAPFDGVVARRLVNRGDLVQAPTGTLMTPLFTVQRIDTIRVFCDVPENDVPHLHIGDAAIVKPSGLDGQQFVGKVTRFSRPVVVAPKSAMLSSQPRRRRRCSR